MAGELSKNNPSDKDKKELDRLRERYVRWQQLSISQLSFTNNLILTFTVAFLGFLVSQKDLISYENGSPCICILKIFSNFFLVASLLSLAASFFFGIITTLNRLKDFRCTAQLVNNKKKRFESKYIKWRKDIDDINSKIKFYKNSTDGLGERTWMLLRCQIWTFAAGTIIGALYILFNRVIA